MYLELKYFQFGLRLDLVIRLSNGEQMFEFDANIFFCYSIFHFEVYVFPR